MQLPTLPIETLQLLLNVYWISAIAAILLKHTSPQVSASLNYGKLSSPKSEREFALLDQPFARPALAWPCFYAAGFLAACLVYIVTTLVIVIPAKTTFVLILFIVQVVRRFMECLMVHRHSETITVTLVQFLAGISFYIAAPLSLLVKDETDHHEVGIHLLEPSQLLMTTFFFIASFAQNHAHRTLASVEPIVGKYGIPRGLLFSLVTCPHYSAEVAIYALFAFQIATMQAGLLFAFVFLNLTDSALRSHKWYCTIFPAELIQSLPSFAIIPAIL